MERQCQCGGSHDERELGVQYNLYEKIDLQNVECLNELAEGSGVKVFKSWEERLDHTKYVESDVDEELLFNIPFTGDIKLKGIIIVGGPGESHPTEVKLFKNREGMTFDEAASEPEQKFELVIDQYGVHEYPVKVAKFSSMHYLTLHFTGNQGAERTRIDYIGLKGEWSPGHRHGVTICSYEAIPQHQDHITSDDSHSDFSREVS
ncbi:PITH domain-containing protein GA19395-like [Copidosoma floridanum]|uniref:PITH domain-containing protein GA19395 n=1 Tax=Copidosoma floridanum TaxID=29053 RepID=UPI0006C9BE78|nr:PITH domain-containing protein GA19395 [Copidosoma floridanum]XP_014208680.1 PITH domain-containing protein GA19395-like [Copidosoma floridanum]